LLVDAKGDTLVELPFAARREALEAFVEAYVPAEVAVHLSPATSDMQTVTEWFRSVGAGWTASSQSSATFRTRPARGTA
jgi:ATP-dependent DNA ligase